MSSICISLDPTAEQVRLLTIFPALTASAPVQASLQLVSLQERPKFEALSYTWGSDEPDNELVLNGEKLGRLSAGLGRR